MICIYDGWWWLLLSFALYVCSVTHNSNTDHPRCICTLLHFPFCVIFGTLHGITGSHTDPHAATKGHVAKQVGRGERNNVFLRGFRSSRFFYISVDIFRLKMCTLVFMLLITSLAIFLSLLKANFDENEGREPDGGGGGEGGGGWWHWHREPDIEVRSHNSTHRLIAISQG